MKTKGNILNKICKQNNEMICKRMSESGRRCQAVAIDTLLSFCRNKAGRQIFSLFYLFPLFSHFNFHFNHLLYFIIIHFVSSQTQKIYIDIHFFLNHT